MMGASAALALLLVGWLGGAGPIELSFGTRAADRTEGAFRLTLALGLGLGLLSGTFCTFLFAGLPRPGALGAACMVVLAIGFAAFAWSRRLPRAVTRLSAGASPGWLVALFAVACAIAAFCVVERSIRDPDGGWDAWMIWNLRARLIFLGGPDLRSAFPSEAIATHPGYPLLLPGLVIAGWTLLGEPAPALPMVVAWFPAVLCPALLTLALIQLRGAVWGLAGGLLLIATPFFVATASQQTADLWVALYVLGAWILMLIARERCGESRGPLLLAGALASMAAWVKNEGLLYLGALAVAHLFPSAERRDPRQRLVDLGWVLLGAAPALALLAWFKLNMAPPEAAYSEPLTAQAARLLEPVRYVTVARWVLRRIVFYQEWTVSLAAAASAWLVVVRHHSARAAAGPLGRALAIVWAGFILIYLMTPLDLVWLVRTTANRLLLQSWPVAILLLLVAAPSREARRVEDVR